MKDLEFHIMAAENSKSESEADNRVSCWSMDHCLRWYSAHSSAAASSGQLVCELYSVAVYAVGQRRVMRLIYSWNYFAASLGHYAKSGVAHKHHRRSRIGFVICPLAPPISIAAGGALRGSLWQNGHTNYQEEHDSTVEDRWTFCSKNCLVSGHYWGDYFDND